MTDEPDKTCRCGQPMNLECSEVNMGSRFFPTIRGMAFWSCPDCGLHCAERLGDSPPDLPQEEWYLDGVRVE
jgi:hypothetical protein